MTNFKSALSFLKFGDFTISGEETVITYEEYEAKIYPIGEKWLVKCSKGYTVYSTIFEVINTLNDAMFELNDLKTGKSFFNQVSEWSQ